MCKINTKELEVWGGGSSERSLLRKFLLSFKMYL